GVEAVAHTPRLHTPEITRDERDALAPIPFERRSDGRATAGGPMQGVIASGADTPELIRLQLVAATGTGSGAPSTAPVQAGERTSIRVDPVHGLWKTATVVRCVPDDSVAGGFRLGLADAQKRAA